MNLNQKERAIAFLAGHGFAFTQFANLIDVRTLWGSVEPFQISAPTIEGILPSLGTIIFAAGMMVLTVFGMWDAYSALRRAGI